MSAGRQRYFIQIDDLGKAHGEHAQTRWDGTSVQGLADAVTDGLRESDLHRRWLQMQEDPDDVDPQMGLLDPQATVSAEMARSRVDLVIESELPHFLIKHRLRLLIGDHWRLYDIKSV